MNDLPEQFTRTVVATFDGGAEWLRDLPALIGDCERRWSLRALPPFPNLSYNYVAPAVRADGEPVVLKLGVPCPDLRTEIAALRVYGGRGAARLLEADADRGALLLEHVSPGAPLGEMDDDEAATAIAADVMRRIWRPAPPDHPFPTVARWFRALGELRAQFDGGTGPLPERLVALAEGLLADLSASMAAPVVLHGDLHHWNILASERGGWLAIDPKGVVGEPACDVGALLHNPMPRLLNLPDPRRALSRRVDILCDALGFDRQRVVGWGVAYAVLSACWSVGDDPSSAKWITEMITCAELLAEMLD